MSGQRTRSRNAVTALAMVAGAGALLIVAFHGTPEVLDYGSGLVPWGVPLVAAALAVAVAELGIAPDFETTPLARVLIVALVVLVVWSAVPLVLDLLRLAGQASGPPTWWGIGLRLLLVLAAAAALVPVITAARTSR